MCIFLGEVNVVKIGPDSGLWPEPGTTRAEKNTGCKENSRPRRSTLYYVGCRGLMPTAAAMHKTLPPPNAEKSPKPQGLGDFDCIKGTG